MGRSRKRKGLLKQRSRPRWQQGQAPLQITSNGCLPGWRMQCGAASTCAAVLLRAALPFPNLGISCSAVGASCCCSQG